jgi:hypothetical protein
MDEHLNFLILYNNNKMINDLFCFEKNLDGLFYQYDGILMNNDQFKLKYTSKYINIIQNVSTFMNKIILNSKYIYSVNYIIKKNIIKNKPHDILMYVHLISKYSGIFDTENAKKINSELLKSLYINNIYNNYVYPKIINDDINI